MAEYRPQRQPQTGSASTFVMHASNKIITSSGYVRSRPQVALITSLPLSGKKLCGYLGRATFRSRRLPLQRHHSEIDYNLECLGSHGRPLRFQRLGCRAQRSRRACPSAGAGLHLYQALGQRSKPPLQRHVQHIINIVAPPRGSGTGTPGVVSNKIPSRTFTIHPPQDRQAFSDCETDAEVGGGSGIDPKPTYTECLWMVSRNFTPASKRA